MTDTPTVDLTLTGSGAPGSPYTVSADVRLDPAPPGGANLLHPGPGGVYATCSDFRGCLSAGNGATYAPTTGQVAARLSVDAGNKVVFGADGGLFVPLPAPPTVGCGLTGDGSAVAPLTVAPAAGQEAWPWPCDVAVESTLKCDPNTGKLWTPPEHYSAADHIYVEHFQGGWATPITATGGWAVVSPGANQRFDVPANFLGNMCRDWSYHVTTAGTWDISYTADATFEVGYALSVNGGGASARPLWGHLTAMGTVRRERASGTVQFAVFNIPASSGASIIVYPAVYVRAGSLTITSWVSDATIHTTTNTS
ncbi:hypothetical protein [Kitasatospora sp. NPDC058046]|uniref:hypothetical protein n=1 Tax=Kitasatospora sp. NPDC058046 TaxID=3346312 RepID=UPI0036DAA39F